MKGSLHGTKVADTKQEKLGSGSSDLASESTVSTRMARVFRKGEQGTSAKGTEKAKPGSSRANARSRGRARSTGIVPTVRDTSPGPQKAGLASKRLTPASVKRLREAGEGVKIRVNHVPKRLSYDTGFGDGAFQAQQEWAVREQYYLGKIKELTSGTKKKEPRGIWDTVTLVVVVATITFFITRLVG